MALCIAISSLLACTGDDPAPIAETASSSSGGSSSGASSTGGVPVVDAGPQCKAGAKECVGSVPRTCDSNGAWHDEAACSGIAPICNAGSCVAFRVHGGIGTLSAAPTAGTLRVRDNGLEQGKRSCAGSLCVTGGIAP